MSEPTISDDEVKAFIALASVPDGTPGNNRPHDPYAAYLKRALAAFLRGRIPEKHDPMLCDYNRECTMTYGKGYNACRDAVLSGGKHGS